MQRPGASTGEEEVAPVRTIEWRCLPESKGQGWMKDFSENDERLRTLERLMMAAPSSPAAGRRERL